MKTDEHQDGVDQDLPPYWVQALELIPVFLMIALAFGGVLAYAQFVA